MENLGAEKSIKIPSKEELIAKIAELRNKPHEMVRRAVSNHLQAYFKLRSKVDLIRINVKRKELFERCYKLADLQLLVKIDDQVPDKDVLHLLSGEFESVTCFSSFAHYGKRYGTPDAFVAYVGSTNVKFLEWLSKNIDSDLLIAAVHAGMLNSFFPLYTVRKLGGNKVNAAQKEVDVVGLFLSIYDALKVSDRSSDFEGIEGIDRFVELCRSEDFSWLRRHPLLSTFGKKGCIREIASAISFLESIRTACHQFDFSSIDDFDYANAFARSDPKRMSAFCQHFGLNGSSHLKKLRQLYPKEVLLRYARLGTLSCLPLDVNSDNRYVHEEAAKGCFRLIKTADCFFYVLEHLEVEPSLLMRYFGFPESKSFESFKEQMLSNRSDSILLELLDAGFLYNSFPNMLSEWDHMKAIRKNERLSNQLDDMRESMCGIGTRRLKLLLNKLIKSGDQVAQAYRMALELEDVNIQAKRSYGKYQDKIYEKKHKLLIELVDLCRQNNYVFGYQSCKGRGVNVIIYFELPHGDQISFHAHMPSIPTYIPPYTKEWNGIENHTLPALETGLLQLYPDEIAKVKASIEKQARNKG